MKDIRDIFYSCDRLSRKWEHYFQIYEKHFEKYIGKSPNILEIGVAHGGSTEMFQKYFENANIFAIDYDTQFQNVVSDLGVTVTPGDQGDPNFWDQYLIDKPEFDIIIDDGGHTMQQQLVTLTKTFPRLRSGGTYLVEDTHTSYWINWGGGFNNPDSFIERTKSLVELLHSPFIKVLQPPEHLMTTFKDLWSVTYYNSVVVLEKNRSRPSVEADNKRGTHES